jgi:hypothetical protein
MNHLPRPITNATDGIKVEAVCCIGTNALMLYVFRTANRVRKKIQGLLERISSGNKT